MRINQSMFLLSDNASIIFDIMMKRIRDKMSGVSQRSGCASHSGVPVGPQGLFPGRDKFEGIRNSLTSHLVVCDRVGMLKSDVFDRKTQI